MGKPLDKEMCKTGTFQESYHAYSLNGIRAHCLDTCVADTRDIGVNCVDVESADEHNDIVNCCQKSHDSHKESRDLTTGACKWSNESHKSPSRRYDLQSGSHGQVKKTPSDENETNGEHNALREKKNNSCMMRNFKIHAEDDQNGLANSSGMLRNKAAEDMQNADSITTKTSQTASKQKTTQSQLSREQQGPGLEILTHKIVNKSRLGSPNKLTPGKRQKTTDKVDETADLPSSDSLQIRREMKAKVGTPIQLSKTATQCIEYIEESINKMFSRWYERTSATPTRQDMEILAYMYKIDYRLVAECFYPVVNRKRGLQTNEKSSARRTLCERYPSLPAKTGENIADRDLLVSRRYRENGRPLKFSDHIVQLASSVCTDPVGLYKRFFQTLESQQAGPALVRGSVMSLNKLCTTADADADNASLAAEPEALQPDNEPQLSSNHYSEEVCNIHKARLNRKRSRQSEENTEVSLSLGSTHADLLRPPVSKPSVLCPPVSTLSVLCPPVSKSSVLCPPVSKSTVFCPPVSKSTVFCPPVSEFSVLCPPVSKSSAFCPPVSKYSALCPPVSKSRFMKLSPEEIVRYVYSLRSS